LAGTAGDRKGMFMKLPCVRVPGFRINVARR
jgi:hypothetical protein